MKKLFLFLTFTFTVFATISAQTPDSAFVQAASELYQPKANKNGVPISPTAPLPLFRKVDGKIQWLRTFLQGQIDNANGVIALKASNARVDSAVGAIATKLSTANALTIFKTLDTYSNDTAVFNTEHRTSLANNINYVRGISDTRDDSLKVAIDAKTDAQTLSINGNTLSILRGNSVNLNTLDSNRYLKRYSKTFAFRNKNVSSDTITTVAKVSAPTATVIFVTASVSSSVFYYEIRLSQSLTDGTWYLVNPKHYSGYGLSIEFSLKRSGSDYYLRCKTADPMMSYGWSTFWSQNVYFDVVAMKSDATASDVAATNLSSSNSSIVESFDNITAAVASSTTLSTDATVVVFSSSSSITATIPTTLGSGKTYSLVNTGTGIVTISYNNSTLFTIAQYEKKKICLIGSNWIEIL